MNRIIYQAIKLAVGMVLAIFIAQFMGLSYSTTAGVIALLSILDTRKQTYYVGLKRVGVALVAIIIATVVFQFAGHTLPALGIFMILFVPLLTLLKGTEGLSISTVLVTHIYTINTLGIGVVLNEMGLVIIGVAIAFILNIHVMSLEGEIQKTQQETEVLIKEILHKMKLQLLNQCSITEQENLIEQLNIVSKKGLADAIAYDNNYILKDYSYFAHYFRMRRQQFFLLRYMEQHFKHIFIEVEEAKLLSDFTERLATELNECNDGYEVLRDLIKLKEHYKEAPLPVTRDEFEHRAELFQYLNDLEYFIKIKSSFMVMYGEILYCR